MKAEEIRRMMADVHIDHDVRLRALASYPDWYLVVDKSNCAILWTCDGLQMIAVMTDRKSPDQVPREFLPMRGRHLMANLPEETQMIAFDLGERHALCLKGQAIARLKKIASALSCEEQLSSPAVPSTIADVSDDVQHILASEWFVLWDKSRPFVKDYKGIKGVMLFTAVDTIDAYLDRHSDSSQIELVHMHGQKLFQLLDVQDDYDGVYVNAGSDLELYPFSPAQIHALAEGKQPRPERRVLRARCPAELEHFLDECGMVAERPHVFEQINGQEVVHYIGKIIPGLEKRTFRFYPLGQDALIETQWGRGASEIVCAGRLAELVRRRLEILAGEIRPLADEFEMFVQTTRVWVDELEKCIDPEFKVLPRRSLRTVDGARFVRENPAIATVQFVENARKALRDGMHS